MWLLLLLALLLAALDWYALLKKNNRLDYFCKPAVLVTLLAWLWASAGSLSLSGEAAHLRWLALGLLLSLLGDVLLMLPRQRFTPGLAAFLLAHLAYIMALGGFLPPNYALRPWVILLCFIVLLGGRVYLSLARGLLAQDRRHLLAPVLVYVLALCAMLLTALTRLVDRNWVVDWWWAYLLAAGALSFTFSDLMLAWDRFVTPIENARLKVRVAYHLGQIGLVVGASLHYLRFL